MIDDRFQNQKWYVKLWRYRWYLLIPFWTMVYLVYRFSATTSYKLAKGVAQSRMNWVYTWKEVEEKIKNKKTLT